MKEDDHRLESLGEFPATDLGPAIADHVAHKLRGAKDLTSAEIGTKITSTNGDRHEVDHPDEIDVTPHEDKKGHFLVRHKKGVIFTATGAALLTAAAGIIYRKAKHHPNKVK